jgi:hypothetical protein
MKIRFVSSNDAGCEITDAEMAQYHKLCMTRLLEVGGPDAEVTLERGPDTLVFVDGERDRDLEALVQDVWEEGEFWAPYESITTPDGRMAYTWTVQFTVSETWVEDGFNLTDERALDMLAKTLSYAYIDRELAAKVVTAPDPKDIRRAQGYLEEPATPERKP